MFGFWSVCPAALTATAASAEGPLKFARQPARAGQMERARGLGRRRSSRSFRGLSGQLPGVAQAAHRRSRADLRRPVERLPQGRRPAAARFRYRSRLLRAEFSARSHRAPGRGRGTADRLFRADRCGLALSQSRIPRPALPPAARPGRCRLQARLRCDFRTRACGSAAAPRTTNWCRITTAAPSRPARSTARSSKSAGSGIRSTCSRSRSKARGA